MYKVTIIDYGIGNILSVQRAFESFGAEVQLTDNPKKIEQADRLVLPGVGAFADGMKGLQERNLIETIRNFVSKERPFLGICLGMQMMMESSQEFGIHSGLGIIKGSVVPISSRGIEGRLHKSPVVGWYNLDKINSESWDGSILNEINDTDSVYFVHSFTSMPIDSQHRLATYQYNGHQITAVIRSGNAYGCQFHPEKSGQVGLRILNSWCKL